MHRTIEQAEDSTTLPGNTWLLEEGAARRAISAGIISGEDGSSAIRGPASYFKKLAASAAVVVLRTTMCNDATSQFVGARLQEKWVRENATTRVAEDRVRDITRQMYVKLSKLEPAELQYGARFTAISEVVGDTPREDPSDYCDALGRMLSVDSKFISGEAKAALIRHTTFLDDSLPLRKLTSLLVTALESDSSTQVIAAARTLGEIGDMGAVPAIRERLRKVPSGSAQREMERAIDQIGFADATTADS